MGVQQSNGIAFFQEDRFAECSSCFAPPDFLDNREVETCKVVPSNQTRFFSQNRGANLICHSPVDDLVEWGAPLGLNPLQVAGPLLFDKVPVFPSPNGPNAEVQAVCGRISPQRLRVVLRSHVAPYLPEKIPKLVNSPCCRGVQHWVEDVYSFGLFCSSSQCFLGPNHIKSNQLPGPSCRGALSGSLGR